MLDSLAELSNILGLMDLSLFAIILWEFDLFNMSFSSFSVLPKIQILSDIFKGYRERYVAWNGLTCENFGIIVKIRFWCSSNLRELINFRGIEINLFQFT